MIGAWVLYLIASGKEGFDAVQSGFAANGYGAHSPGGYTLVAAFVAELFLTYMFLLIILGATDRRVPTGFAPIAIGLALTLIHLISIPVTNTSVNPARSTGPALFVGGWALGQLWLFWFAPIVGAILAGFTYRWLGQEVTEKVVGGGCTRSSGTENLTVLRLARRIPGSLLSAGVRRRVQDRGQHTNLTTDNF